MLSVVYRWSDRPRVLSLIRLLNIGTVVKHKILLVRSPDRRHHVSAVFTDNPWLCFSEVNHIRQLFEALVWADFLDDISAFIPLFTQPRTLPSEAGSPLWIGVIKNETFCIYKNKSLNFLELKYEILDIYHMTFNVRVIRWSLLVV